MQRALSPREVQRSCFPIVSEKGRVQSVNNNHAIEIPRLSSLQDAGYATVRQMRGASIRLFPYPIQISCNPRAFLVEVT